jgi:hypothetical protein
MKIRFGSASVLFFAMAILLCDIADGGEIIARLKVSAPSVDYIDVPVHAAIELPKRLAGVSLEKIKVRIRPLTDKFVNVSIPGQLVRNDKGKVEAWWVVPRLKANSTTEWTVDVPVPDRPNTGFGPVEAFSWQDKAGEYLDLLFDGKKVTRYMHAHDTSGEQRAFETYKPFHHVFDTSGNLVTNGPDGSRTTAVFSSGGTS